MHIYLKHPVHGAKVATMELEAKEDIKNGWVRYTLNEPSKTVTPVNQLKRRRKME